MGIPVVILDESSVAQASGSPSNAITANVAVGSLVVVALFPQTANGPAVVSLVDSAGNNYSIAAQTPPTAGFLLTAIGFCYIKNALVSGVSTFTATTGAGDTISYIACAVQTVAAGGGFDAANTGSSASGGITIATGSLAQASEVVFGAYSPNGTTTFTEASGWTSLGGVPGNEDLSYQIVSSRASVTYNPTWPQTINASGVITSFKFALIPVFELGMGSGYSQTKVVAY